MISQLIVFEFIKRKKIIEKLLCVFFSIILFLCVLEGVLRFVGVPEAELAIVEGSPAIFDKSEYNIWTLRKNVSSRHVSHTRDNGTYEYDYILHLNNAGFRDVEDISVKKPDNEYRIMFIGDSYTFGWGVPDEDTFCAQLQHSYDSHETVNHKRIRVINAGYVGKSPDTYRLFLLNCGLKYQPDVVVIQHCGNDYLDVTQNRCEKDNQRGLPEKITWPYVAIGEDHRLHFMVTPYGKIPINKYLMANSYAYRFVIRRLDMLLKKRYEHADQNAVAWQALKEADINLKLRLREAHKRLLNSYTEIKRICDEHNIQLYAFSATGNNTTGESFFLDYLNDIGITTMTYEPYPKESYFKYDAHWNVLGHTITAKRLQSFLNRQLDLIESI